MNPFIDAQKRSIELPFGCKDLGEVPQSGDHPGFKSRFKSVKGLSEAERYMTSLLLAPGLTFVSIVGLPKFEHHLHLGPVLAALAVLLRIDGNDKARLKRIRRFFQNAGISPIVDSFGGIINDKPYRVGIYPLPIDAPDAAELIIRLLRDGFALPENAELYFSSNEKSIA